MNSIVSKLYLLGMVSILLFVYSWGAETKTLVDQMPLTREVSLRELFVSLLSDSENKYKEEDILSLIQKGDSQKAKKVLKKLFYADVERVPSLQLIKEVSRYKTNQEIQEILVLLIAALPARIIEALPSIYVQEVLMALSFVLQVIAQEGLILALDPLNMLFANLYERFDFNNFAEKEDRVTKVTTYRTTAFVLYQIICKGYEDAAKRAQSAGHFEVLKKITSSPYYILRAHDKSSLVFIA